MPRRFSLLLGLLTALSPAVLRRLFLRTSDTGAAGGDPAFPCDTDVSYQDMHVKGKLTRMEEGTDFRAGRTGVPGRSDHEMGWGNHLL